MNFQERWRGHLWQGHLASFPMDEAHFRASVNVVLDVEGLEVSVK